MLDFAIVFSAIGLWLIIGIVLLGALIDWIQKKRGRILTLEEEIELEINNIEEALLLLDRSSFKIKTWKESLKKVMKSAS